MYLSLVLPSGLYAVSASNPVERQIASSCANAY